MTKDIQTTDANFGQTFFSILEGQAPLPQPNPVWLGHGGGYAYYLGMYQSIIMTCSNVYLSHYVPGFIYVDQTPTYADKRTRTRQTHALYMLKHAQKELMHALPHISRIAWNRLMHAMNGNKNNKVALAMGYWNCRKGLLDS